MIKFLDIQKINAQYSDELKLLANDVINSGWYLMGDKVKNFEAELADFIGAKHVIACANGLDALRLIMKAYIQLGIFKEGDEVIVPANTYIATILAITDNRLKPVLIEPDILTYNLNISLLEKAITAKTCAILPVHLYGRVCWSKQLTEFGRTHNLKIIEDNAQAIGAKWNEIRTGCLGDAAGFSFYPGKNLGALGDSGAVCTNNNELADVVRTIANYGSKQKYINLYQGLNSRMDELQAGFLSIKLKYLDAENQTRRTIANFYTEHISNPSIILPQVPVDEEHVWHLFVVRTENRDKLQHYLTEKGIQTLIHYPIPPHKQKAYEEWNVKDFPVTEKIHNEILSLPISPVHSWSEIQYISDTINKYS